MRIGEQNKRFYAEVGIFTAFYFLIGVCVFLNGDDFMYATFAKEGILESVSSYYKTGNGRFLINVLDSLLLSFDRYLFIILNPFIILSFVFLMAKNIVWILEKSSDWEKEKLYIRYGMALFACLDILCLRETVFWITGMMNYLFPATVFLAGLWMFQQMRAAKKVAWPKVFGYWAFCFFAGFSVEQYALMFVGVMTLLMLSDMICKIEFKPCLVIGYLAALIGLALLIFAPGNFVRMEENKPPFIDNIWTLVYQDTLSPVAFPFLLMLSMCSNAFMARRRMNKLYALGCMLIPILMLAIQCIVQLEKAIIICAVLLLVIGQLFYLFIYRSYAEKLEIVSLILVGLGSQVMLLISPVWGFRCMLSLYMVYMLLLIYYLPQLGIKEQKLILGSGVIGSISPIALAVVWFFSFLIKKNERMMDVIWNTIILGGTVFSLSVLLWGYADNAAVHKKNIQLTEKAFERGVLEIDELQNEAYGWYSVPMSGFHEGYYRKYHELPEEIKINYLENIEGN